MTLKDILQGTVDLEASDVFLRTKAYPRVRVNGKIIILKKEVLSKEDMIEIADYLLSIEHRKKVFDAVKGVDFIHDEEGVGRFRVNMFMQRGTPALVARHVITHIKTFEALNLPTEVCKLFCEETKGLFLVCGPAGNGKSTTIASMLEYINMLKAQHIMTLEDPIEFLFQDKESMINQRELGFDVPSYAEALKHVTQQSPDIIYIGNIRDNATMSAAITATELGAFVMSTFHTVNAVETVIRMVNFFPPHLHDEVRMQLAMILRGTISLRLIPLKDGSGRIPAYETMLVTPTISRLIRENKIKEIQHYINEGELFGMQSFQKSLVRLVKSGLVDEIDASRYADSKDDFNLELKGISRDLN